jgi:uncharacterized protein YlxP (DUF503 family)
MSLLTAEQKEYTNKKNTLIKIHDVKVNYPMKADLLTILTKDLNKFNIDVEKINYTEAENKKTFTLNLISSHDRQVTQLIEHLTKKHEKRFKFDLQIINFDEDFKKYFSELKVSIL